MCTIQGISSYVVSVHIDLKISKTITTKFEIAGMLIEAVRFNISRSVGRREAEQGIQKCSPLHDLAVALQKLNPILLLTWYSFISSFTLARNT
jgi:hypothetical protein